MRKTLKTAFLIALVITLIGMAVNGAFYAAGNIMPLSVPIYGGEVIMDIGFGLRAVYVYSMLPDGGSSRHLYFSPVSLIICLIPITLAVFLVLLVINKFKNKK